MAVGGKRRLSISENPAADGGGVFVDREADVFSNL